MNKIWWNDNEASRNHPDDGDRSYDWELDRARAAVEKTRRERGIDPHHDSGADSGSLSEDEEREISRRPR